MASIAIRTILAGDETGVPGDSPFERLDVGNEYSFVGALSMQLGARTSSATGVALSPEWILIAAHTAPCCSWPLPPVHNNKMQVSYHVLFGKMKVRCPFWIPSTLREEFEGDIDFDSFPTNWVEQPG